METIEIFSKQIELNWSDKDVLQWIKKMNTDEFFCNVYLVHTSDEILLLLYTHKNVWRLKIANEEFLCKLLLNLKLNNFKVIATIPSDEKLDKLKFQDHYDINRVAVYSETNLSSHMDSVLKLPQNNSTYSTKPSTSLCSIKSDIMRALLAFAFLISVTLWHALMIVINHSRLPNYRKYPPLPDILLETLSRLSWAFVVAETMMLTLLAMFVTLIIFHKHRIVILRRIFVLLGKAYLLRSITVVTTSLSVPSKHLYSKCNPLPVEGFFDLATKTLINWSSGGLTIRGVTTCGDYMFSGHTIVLTLMNLFIIEYTSGRCALLHVFTTLLNILGIFFVMAAHEHYTIDVILALFVCSALFESYHYYANNNLQSSYGTTRNYCFCPITKYLESHMSGPIVNEYDCRMLCLIEFWQSHGLPLFRNICATWTCASLRNPIRYCPHFRRKATNL